MFRVLISYRDGISLFRGAIYTARPAQRHTAPHARTRNGLRLATQENRTQRTREHVGEAARCSASAPRRVRALEEHSPDHKGSRRAARRGICRHHSLGAVHAIAGGTGAKAASDYGGLRPDLAYVDLLVITAGGDDWLRRVERDFVD